MGKRSSARQLNGGRRHSGSRRLWLLPLLAIPLLVGLGVAVASVLVPGTQSGSLTPERTRVDLGTIPYNGGLARTAFSLHVTGEVRVTGLSTT